jgi:hypothetical protein
MEKASVQSELLDLGVDHPSLIVHVVGSSFERDCDPLLLICGIFRFVHRTPAVAKQCMGRLTV